MTARINIIRDRWTIREIPSETGQRLAALALVIGDEHFPYLEYPDTRRLSEGLSEAADGGSKCEITIGEERIVVESLSDGVRITCSGSYKLTTSDARQLAKDLVEPLAQTLTGKD